MSVKSPYTTKTERGGYSAIVYKDGDLCVAEDNVGTIIQADSDATTVIQAALDAIAARGRGKLVQLKGTYTWTTAVTYSASNLEWEGVGGVINDSSAIAGTAGALRIEGAITGTTSVLTVEAAKGQKDVTVADANNFSAGDWIRVRSETVFNSGTQHLGELQKIASIAGNVITCEDVLAFTYTLADTATVDLLTVYENIKLKNMHFIGNYGESGWHGFTLWEVYNVLIENITWTDSQCYPISVSDVVAFEMKGCTVKDSDQAGLGYGVAIGSASRDILIHHNKFYNCRHGITCGGDGTYGVQTNQIYDANIFRHSIRTAGGMGPHNTYDGLVVSNNTVMNDTLVNVASLNTVVVGNNVYNDAGGNGGVYVGIAAKNVAIVSNTIKCKDKKGILITDGNHISINGNSIEVEGAYSAIYGEANGSDIVISNNIISESGAGGAIYFRTNGASAAVKKFVITGNIMVCTNQSAIRFRPYGFNLERIQIQNNHIEAPGTAAVQMVYGSGIGISKYVTISNNQITNSHYGVYVGNTDYFSITNNLIDTITNIGIHVCDADVGCHFYNIEDNQLTAITNEDILDQMGTGLVYRQHSNLFMDVLAVSATHVRSNEDLGEAIPNTFAIDAQPDVPRTLSGHFDTHAQITAYTIVITGVDAKGNTISETKTEADGWDWETNNAFATITSIIMTERTGTGVGDTMDIGITDVLGLSNIIYETGDVFKIKKDNANATVATAQVNTTYDTYDMSVIGLAATNDFTIWYKSNLNMIS